MFTFKGESAEGVCSYGLALTHQDICDLLVGRRLQADFEPLDASPAQVTILAAENNTEALLQVALGSPEGSMEGLEVVRCKASKAHRKGKRR